MKRIIFIVCFLSVFVGNSQIPLRFWENFIERFKVSIPNKFTPNDIPSNAYYLQPNGTGDFTKSMVENAVDNGENYIVFDTDTLNVYYANSPHVINAQNIYLDLELQGTLENPITLDFRNVYINCYPDKTNILKNYNVFSFRNTENVVIKFGTVEGDKFKRTLDTDEEVSFESSYCVFSSFGTKNLVIEGNEMSGFMGDVITGSPFGSTAIDTNPLSNNYTSVGSNRYESVFYNINPETYNTFGLVGGLGYNRLLCYDMFDVIFKFFNSSDTQIAEITGGEYFKTYEFPNVAGITKMKVNVRAMDGRNESPTNFGHNLQYNPNSGVTIRNSKISNNHRGGVSNVGANATINNAVFDNSERYDEVPEFGVLAFPFSTRYHINCEDVVSKNLIIKNSFFFDKFHKILLTHNINAEITNNTFSGEGNSISINFLLSGKISGNYFNTGSVLGGTGTNKNTVIVENNTGITNVELTNGAEWKNNIINNPTLSGKGKATSNVFNNANFSSLNFTKEIQGNTFNGNGSNNELFANSYIYNNIFNGVSFRISEYGSLLDTVVLDSVLVDNTANNALYVIDRYNTPMTVIAKNVEFIGAKFRHASVNLATDYQEGSYYFQNCIFTNIDDFLFRLETNVVSTVPVKYYFKDCTFTGTGDFITKTYIEGLYEITFDNCTIAGTITLPPVYTEATVTMPTIVEPRTQPIPTITRNEGEGRTEIATDFHIMTLKIRNKTTSEIVLDEDVCSTYLHYNATPTNFEYSIDGGVYWDELP